MAIDDRLFQRGSAGRTPRWYVDLRDVGGGQRACIPQDGTRATTEKRIALPIAKRLLKEALDSQERREKSGVRGVRRLEEYAKYHVQQKEKEQDLASTTLGTYRRALLDAAVDHFGSDRRLEAITPRDVKGFIDYLARQPNGRGGTFSESTQRAYLACLSNLMRRAKAEGFVTSNPVGDLLPEHKPQANGDYEADYLEPDEAALLYEAARAYEPPEDGGTPHIFPIIGLFLLTGMRKSELLGLRVEDLDFERKQIRVRPNEWRGLKNKYSRRTVPLWPQARKLLREYMFNREEPLGDLLFPSHVGERESQIRDMRKTLDAVGKLAGFEEGRIRTKIFRHTYASVRLQTLDAGQPVAPFTVARELGHSGTDMIMRRYGHLLGTRVRSEVVEYRADEFPELEDRLSALRAAS